MEKASRGGINQLWVVEIKQKNKRMDKARRGGKNPPRAVEHMKKKKIILEVKTQPEL